MPIRLRLAAAALTVLVLLLVAITVFVPLRLGHDLATQADESLRRRAEQLSADYAREGESEFVETANAATTGLPGTQSWAQLLALGGGVVKSAGDDRTTAPAVGPDVVAEVLAGGPKLMTLESAVPEQAGQQPFRVIVHPVGGPGEHTVLVLGTSLGVFQRVVDQLRLLLVLAGAGAVVLAGGTVWWLARLALLPITRISRQAERIHVDHLDERIPVPAAEDELGNLARTLNTMFDRLRQGVAEQRRLVADTSHELRTPLAIMRAELDAALAIAELPEEAALGLARNVAEVDRMSRIVANLLTLARVDRGELELLLRPVDLREEADAVASRFRELTAAKGLSLTVVGDAPLVAADRERIDQVLSNLVDNAVKYTPAGAVEIRLWSGEGVAGVTVADTGPGIAAEEFDRVFDRFYRIDSARTRAAGGSGLGLAISREIIKAHAGAIWVHSTPGQGSQFTFTLPRTGC